MASPPFSPESDFLSANSSDSEEEAMCTSRNKRVITACSRHRALRKKCPADCAERRGPRPTASKQKPKQLRKAFRKWQHVQRQASTAGQLPSRTRRSLAAQLSETLSQLSTPAGSPLIERGGTLLPTAAAQHALQWRTASLFPASSPSFLASGGVGGVSMQPQCATSYASDNVDCGDGRGQRDERQQQQQAVEHAAGTQQLAAAVMRPRPVPGELPPSQQRTAAAAGLLYAGWEDLVSIHVWCAAKRQDISWRQYRSTHAASQTHLPDLPDLPAQLLQLPLSASLANDS
eukprot:TRINITY_DN1548_c0_g1_i8.p2 TRINITY_DN1548_c0_g1~~TRINITY_DN1548_c0_g1_i8.p2  ORF type:complete len:289 (-),score=80.42 TRINITY_DN1548_c0_g1_i8:2624-3490(-)